MKRIFTFILVFICVALLFAGCKFFTHDIEDTTISKKTTKITNFDTTTNDTTDYITTQSDTTGAITGVITDAITTQSSTTMSPVDSNWTKPY